MAREEGLLLGYSAGSALAGLLQLSTRLTNDDVVVIIFHDHGSRYVGKIYNDEWMIERGFLDRDIKVKDLIELKLNKNFISVEVSTSVREALSLMKDADISQTPVTENGSIVGSLTEKQLLNFILENPSDNVNQAVRKIMTEPFPVVSEDIPIKDLNRYITREVPAVITKDRSGAHHVITQYDIIQAI